MLFLCTHRIPVVGSRVGLDVQSPDSRTITIPGLVRRVVTPEHAWSEDADPGVVVVLESSHSKDLLLLERLTEMVGR